MRCCDMVSNSLGSDVEINRLIDKLLETVGDMHHPEKIREMLLSVIKIGVDVDYLADLKMISQTLRELSETTRVFAPYRHKRKVTIFGSARTGHNNEMYQKCLKFSRALAEQGYMTITGGGSGIMQAGNEGAGSENSFAANILLPFEQEPNHVMSQTNRLITYRYFFNRKVALVKEADALVVFPGGFGTLDEAMEVSTLIQTGKTSPRPLILIDDQEGYWEQFLDFVKESMLLNDFISAEDFSIFTITRDENEAVRVIENFYRIYHSLRFIKNRLVIRLKKRLTPEQINILEEEFSDLMKEGDHICSCGPYPEEADEPDLAALHRISLIFDHGRYGLLLAFIRRINTF